MYDLISRQAAIDAANEECFELRGIFARIEEKLKALPSVQPEIIRCKDCKYFELDHFEKIKGLPIPVIAAHEICMKWGDGCKSSVDGWCFMAERRTDSDGRV